MRNELFVWACTPQEEPGPALRGARRAQLGYRISDTGRLFYGFARKPSGGILTLSDDGTGRPDAEAFLPELEKELRRGAFSGIFADLEAVTPSLFALAGGLETLAQRLRIPLFVPEAYAAGTQRAFVLIGSDVAAGDYALRLEEAALRFGPRLALELVPLRADFALPGQGRAQPLTREELRGLLEHGAQVYYSQALCANYFTYRDGGQDTHFVLFDDEKSLMRKCELAEKAGVGSIFALYQEAAPFFSDNPALSDAY